MHVANRMSVCRADNELICRARLIRLRSTEPRPTIVAPRRVV